MAANTMVGAHVNELVPTVTPRQALELFELGFTRLDVCSQTLERLDGLAARLPRDVPVVVVGQTAELSRRATLILGRRGIDALDAGVLTVARRRVA